MRRLYALFATLILLANSLPAFAQAPAQCTISGTVYNPDGSAAAGAQVKIGKITIAGKVLAQGPYTYTADGSGAVSFSVARGARCYIYSTASPFNVTGGISVQIPNSATAALESLASVATVAVAGVTVKSNGTSLSDFIGTLNFSSSFTVSETPSLTAFIDLSFTPFTSPMSAVGDLIYGGSSGAATRLAGNTTVTRKFLRQTGSGSASAAPGWDTLVSGDLPSHVHAASDITSGALAKARQYADTVYTDQSNVFGAFLQDLSAASLKVPIGAGAAPTISGLVAYDSTANQFRGGVNGSSNYLVQAAAALTNNAVLVGGGNGAASSLALGASEYVLGMNSAGTANVYKSSLIGVGLYDAGGAVISVKSNKGGSACACDGTTDDASALQAKINALPSTGGIVDFEGCPDMKINAEVDLGNGTSSALSTPQAIVLRGASGHHLDATGSTHPTRIIAGAGLSGGTMFKIKGPIGGVRIENIMLECNALANTAIDSMAA